MSELVRGIWLIALIGTGVAMIVDAVSIARERREYRAILETFE